jgi:TolB protein
VDLLQLGPERVNAEMEDAAGWKRGEQVTRDEYGNWTPHPSLDRQSVVIVSYPKGVTGHPTNTDISFRILNVADGKLRTLVDVVN